jgi:hypothetical protein
MSEEIYNDTTLDIIDKMNEFIKLYDEIASYAHNVQKHQADMDKELSDFYHLAEGVEVKHITQSHKMFLKLKSILNRRRMSKLPVHLVQSFMDNLGPKMKIVRKRHYELINKHRELIASLGKNKDVTQVMKKLKI